ncbi:MAG TPA: GNAT family N-acetyltransferase [Candidatus Eisenbacteria bacterium]|nr:GNAT family N-acetyltransferase [Candidatus Eisenbacteria bacterium]
MSVRLEEPRSAGDWARARRLVEAYAAALPIDLSFQEFAAELDDLARHYAPPTGAFFIAVEANEPLGCVGVRRFEEGVGEIKRLYVAPAARGRGVGRLLAEAAVEAGTRLGYARLLLDTLPSMSEALALYRSLGFRPTEAYRFNPVPGAVYMERTIS